MFLTKTSVEDKDERHLQDVFIITNVWWGIKVTNDNNGEKMPHLEITEVTLVHCNIVNSDCQQHSRVLYTFASNKPLGKLLDIPAKNVLFSKTFNSEFSY